MENWLWYRLWGCRKADKDINELVKFPSTFMFAGYLISNTERTQLRICVGWQMESFF